MEKREINNREDIEFLIDDFYKKVIQDETIKHFFTEVVQLDWSVHIPIMYDFWETVLLKKMKYSGNPMTAHIHLHQKSALKKEHFDAWLLLWKATIRAHFEGEKADEAIDRAEKMAALITYKIEQSKRNTFIQ
jgi:hemoglobin